MQEIQSCTVAKEKTFDGTAVNLVDAETGNPAGGSCQGLGISIEWQGKPLGLGVDRQPATGAFVENVIGAALQRLQFYQDGRFFCHENDIAILNLRAALKVLRMRTERRKALGVEGTHTV
jgi:hypothetical protein